MFEEREERVWTYSQSDGKIVQTTRQVNDSDVTSTEFNIKLSLEEFMQFAACMISVESDSVVFQTLRNEVEEFIENTWMVDQIEEEAFDMYWANFEQQ